MNLLRAATVSVANPAATAARYERWLDYRVVEEGRIPEQLAHSWGAPGAAGRAYVVMAPASGANVYLRFVACDPVPEFRPLRTFGWAALELCVVDVLKVNDRLRDSPFEIIGPPREIEGLSAIFPMQVRGPDDEVVFLTQIRNDLPMYDLPRAKSLVDHLFIVVMGCANMTRTGEWFQQQLRLSPGREMEIVYSVLAQAFGSPPEELHRINTLTHERNVFLEIDQYPHAATPRPQIDGQLVPGIASVTLQHPQFAALEGQITAAARHAGVLYGGNPSMCLRTPEGALVEVVGVT